MTSELERGGGAVPGQLRVAVGVLGVEILALLAGGAFLLAETAGGHPDSAARALLGAGLAFLAALVLGACSRGLLTLRPPARTPVVVLQLLALPVGFSLGFQAGRIGYGGPIVLAALVVLYLLFTPPVRRVLDRQLD